MDILLQQGFTLYCGEQKGEFNKLLEHIDKRNKSMSYIIDKTFDFCYGHRVWSQQLNKEYSLNSCLACRHMHGHQGQIKVHLEAQELVNDMVTDFKNLKWFSKWLDDTLDHKFIMDISDPLYFYEVERDLKYAMEDEYYVEDNIEILEQHDEDYWTIKPSVYENLKPCLKEKYEGLIIVPFVPTSENLCKWLFDIVSEKMQKINVKVSKIEFNETPKSRSIYIG